MTAGLPTRSPHPSNWNRSLFGWIIKSSITFVWLPVVRGENVMMGGFQCFVSPPRDAQTFLCFLLQCRNWNWALFNSWLTVWRQTRNQQCVTFNLERNHCDRNLSIKRSISFNFETQSLKLSNASTFRNNIILCQKTDEWVFSDKRCDQYAGGREDN